MWLRSEEGLGHKSSISTLCFLDPLHLQLFPFDTSSIHPAVKYTQCRQTVPGLLGEVAFGGRFHPTLLGGGLDVSPLYWRRGESTQGFLLTRDWIHDDDHFYFFRHLLSQIYQKPQSLFSPRPSWRMSVCSWCFHWTEVTSLLPFLSRDPHLYTSVGCFPTHLLRMMSNIALVEKWFLKRRQFRSLLLTSMS